MTLFILASTAYTVAFFLLILKELPTKFNFRFYSTMIVAMCVLGIVNRHFNADGDGPLILYMLIGIVPLVVYCVTLVKLLMLYRTPAFKTALKKSLEDTFPNKK